MATYTKIASNTVASGGVASVTFSSIPATYTDLIVKASARTARTGSNLDILFLTLNTLTTNQTSLYLYGDGFGVVSGTDTRIWGLAASTDNETALVFGNSEMMITNYAGSNNKAMSSDFSNENNATGAYLGFNAGLWSASAAINSIQISSATSNTIKEHSTFTLYGISNA
jgi:hypothetical protein